MIQHFCSTTARSITNGDPGEFQWSVDEQSAHLSRVVATCDPRARAVVDFAPLADVRWRLARPGPPPSAAEVPASGGRHLRECICTTIICNLQTLYQYLYEYRYIQFYLPFILLYKHFILQINLHTVVANNVQYKPCGEGSIRAIDLLRMSSRVSNRSRPAMHQSRRTEADSGLRTMETRSRRSSGRLDSPGLPGVRRRTNKSSLLAIDPDGQNSPVMNGVSVTKGCNNDVQ